MKKKLMASVVSIMLTITLSAPSLASTIPTATTDESTTAYTLAAVVPVTNVSLKSSLTLIEGNISYLIASIAPKRATNKQVTWESSDITVAKVDQNGKVIGVKEGKALITVTTLDGSKTATCTVTVTVPPVDVTGVSLDESSETIDAYTSISLSATVAPTNASNQKVTWKSSNTAVAKVDKNGEVYGKKAGTATITVTTIDGKKKATCKIKVVLPKGSVTGVKLKKTSLTLFEGSSKFLEETVSPSNAINKDVIWRSLEPSIASVDSDGRVTAQEKGITQIMVTTVDGNKIAFCTVTVKR